MKIIKGILSSTFIFCIFFISCKSTSNQTYKVGNTPEIESELVKNIIKSETDTAVISLKKQSLKSLLKLYSKKISPLKSVYTKNQILKAIVNKHEINSDLYAKYRDDFWNQNTTYIHTFSDGDLINLLKNASDTDYILFTFSKDKVATDFNMQIINTHVFNSFVSCFPAVLLKEMIANDHKKITIGKGLKYIANPPYNLQKGSYNIAMLKFFDTNGDVQYFDIVEDPSLSK